MTRARDPDPISEAQPTPSPIELDREFDEIWPHYPRRQAEGRCRREYHRKRRAGVERETIANGVMRLAARCTGADLRYVPFFATWLKDGGWLDQIAVQPEFVMPVGGGRINGHRTKPSPTENLYRGFAAAAAGYGDSGVDRPPDEPLLDRRRSAGD